MDITDKKILIYLTEKDWAAESPVLNETFKDFGLTKEEYKNRLSVLQSKYLIEYQRPFGSDAFIRITNKGRTAVKPTPVRIKDYLENHVVELLTLLVALVTLYLSLIG